jgi:hypothetical protein
LYVVPDKGDAARRLVWHDKANLGPHASTLAWTLEEGPVVAWEPGEVLIDNVNAYLNTGQGKRQGRPPGGADTWLLQYLASLPGRIKANQVIKTGEAAGYSRRTLYRVAQEIGVIRGDGYWHLPEAQDDQVLRI